MIKKNILLVITALIWGFNFVAQSVSMEAVGPMFFCFVRFALASLGMGLVVLIQNKKDDNNNHLKAGIIAGVVLFFASYFQQYGLVYATPGKSAFISALYIIFVPLISFILYRKTIKPDLKTWVCVFIAVVGLYSLTVTGNERAQFSDLITLFSAFLYAVHIIVIDKYADNCNPYKFSLVQFVVCAVLGLFASMILHEQISLSALKDCALPLLYVSLIGTCGAYTFQTLGQIGNDPTIASLVMSLESVFGALSGYLLLNQKLTRDELIGCILIFIAIILIQIPSRKTKKKIEN